MYSAPKHMLKNLPTCTSSTSSWICFECRNKAYLCEAIKNAVGMKLSRDR